MDLEQQQHRNNTNRHWSSLEKEFALYATLWRWVNLIDTLKDGKRSSIAKMNEIVSTTLGAGLLLLAKGEFYKFFSKVIGEPADALAEAIKNEFKCFTTKRSVMTLLKIIESCKEKEIEIKSIKAKNLIPLLESLSYSLEDDDEEDSIQEKWKNLLTAAIVSDEYEIDCLDILKKLKPIHAKILDLLFEFEIGHPETIMTCQSVRSFFLNKNQKVSDETLIKALDYLIHLNLCQIARNYSQVGGLPKKISIHSNEEGIGLTSFGTTFMQNINFSIS